MKETIFLKLSDTGEIETGRSNLVKAFKQFAGKYKKKAWGKQKFKITTSALTKAAIRTLLLSGWYVWRQNNAAVYDTKLNKFRANSATKGISDIIGFNKKTGQFIAVEIKNGEDKLSYEQTAFLNEVKRGGGIGLVVKDMNDVENICNIQNNV